MNQILIATILSIALFIGILILMEIGRWVGSRRLALDPKGARAGTGTVESAVFALVGLLIAFTFSGAATRFDTRRALIVQETNAIGTAYLRLDLLSEDVQPVMRDLFRRYVDARLEIYRRVTDQQATMAAMDEAIRLQGLIWQQAVTGGQHEGSATDAIRLLLPALNDMIDISTSRTLSAKQHPPLIIYLMLVGLTLASALLAGYDMAGGKSRNWLHILGFAAVMALAVYVIIDLEFPRLGLIRVDTFDQALFDLRQSMR
jgi:hypothetical protein